MDYEFLNGFTPRIIDVVVRQSKYWEQFQYLLEREETRLNVCAYVYSGRGVYELSGKKAELYPGCLFQANPGQLMRIATSASDVLCFYSIHFWYGSARWEGSDMTWQPGGGLLPMPIVTDVGEHAAMLETFERVYRLWNEKNSGYEWHAKNGLYAVLQQVNRLESQRHLEQEPGAASAVQSVIEYLKEHYGEDLSRESLAKHVSLSPGYLSVSFKRHTGLSPIQYLNKIRIDEAKRLLRGTKLSVKQIAEQTGFADSFYFTRLFSKETGMPPRDYRNS